MNKDNKGFKYQDKDAFVWVPDLSERIVRTTMREIKDAYNEFMEELMLESMEAY